VHHPVASSANDLPGPSAIADSVRPQLGPSSAQHDLARYKDAITHLDALSTELAVDALRRLGWSFPREQRFTTDGLAGELGIPERYRRLLGRLLAILADDEIVQRAEDGWLVLREPPAPPDLAARSGALRAEYPNAGAEIALTARCGARLADVLRGACDPLTLLFPGGSLDVTSELYRTSPPAQVYNGLVQQAIAQALASASGARPIRILEIGAGTGGTTGFVLPALPSDRVAYTFTDVSPHFTAGAREQFRAYPFVEYATLDIEKDPRGQGFGEDRFDIVLAANVLHATSDLRRTLQHVRHLLAPAGLLVVLEGTTRHPWVDLTFGLTEGWWRFTDDERRPDYPLLSRAGWLRLLGELGFREPVGISDEEPVGTASLGQVVLLARADETPLPVAPDVQEAAWLILADRSGVGRELAAALRSRGEPCVTVVPGDACGSPGDGCWQVNPARVDDLRQVLRAMPGDGRRRQIVHLWGLDAVDPASLPPDAPLNDQIDILDGVARLVQALDDARDAPPSSLWLVTRNAQPVDDRSPAPAVAQAPLWGLGRVIALEHPSIWGGLIDVESEQSARLAAADLLATITRANGEDQIALRNGRRHVPRLVRSGRPRSRPLRWRSDAAYLITGGLGDLGLTLARWMAEQGAGHLVLVGRRGLPDLSARGSYPSDSREERQVRAIRAIEALGATITVVAADVGDRAAMTELFARFGTTLPSLRGIAHAAAAWSAAPVQTLSRDAIAGMLHSKAVGAWVLHTLSRASDLDFFLLFSSTTSLWGARDLAHYAAANQFLDSLAHMRHAAGLPALSVNWGTWDQMQAASDEAQRQYAQFGLRPMSSAHALETLGSVLGDGELREITVASVDWGRLRPAYEARRQRPLFAEISDPDRTPHRPQQERQASLVQRLKTVPASRWHETIAEHVHAEVARVLGVGPLQQIDRHQGLFEMGMDSLMSVELRERLEAGVGRSLPSTLTFNYASVAALTDYLAANVLVPDVNALADDRSPPAVLPPTPLGTVEPDVLSEDDLADLLAAKLAQIQ
jgi:SAM-dependent methyltransferase